jgi:hypothetical protein
MSQNFKSEIKLEALSNATSDTDRFLVSDSGIIKYRTGAEVRLDIGADSVSIVKHQVKAGVAINKGQAVYVTSADGTNMIVGLASNASEATSSKTMGLLDATVAINGFANVVTEGLLAGLNTSTATAGDPVWLGTGGNLIYGLANKPYAPAHLVFIGIVTRVNSNNGEIFVKVQNGFELDELHNVDLKTTTPINGHLLGFNGTLWVNKTIAGWLGYTPANASGTTNYVSKFTGSTTLGNSLIFDNGTNVGIGTTGPSEKLHISGNSLITGTLEVDTVNNGVGDFLTRTAGGIVTRRTAAEVRSDIGAQAALTNPVTGTGTLNFVSKFTSTGSTLGNSQIFDNGTSVGIGTSGPLNKVDIVSSNNDSFGAITVRPSNQTQTLSLGWQGVSASLNFIVNAGASERMRITSVGNTGINTSIPETRLQIEDITKVLTNNVSGVAQGTLSLVSTDAQAANIGASLVFGGNYIDSNSTRIAYAAITGRKSNGTTSNADGYLSFLTWRTSGLTEAMRITSAGNVGIGTNSAGTRLYVDYTTNGSDGIVSRNLSAGTSAFGYVGAFNNLTNGIDLRSYSSTHASLPSTSVIQSSSGQTGGTIIIQSGANPIRFNTNASERMRISGAGEVGIGTTSPSARLQVVGGSDTWTGLALRDGGSDIPIIDFRVSDNSTRGSIRISGVNSAGGDRLGLFSWIAGTGLSEVMSIKGGGNVGIGTTAPSFPLSFGTALGNKIALYDASSGNGYGFGVQVSLLQMFSNAVGDDITFGYGNSASMVRNVTFKGTGNVGIGTTAPVDKLDVNGSIRFRLNTPSFTGAVDSGVLDFVPTSIFPTDPQIRLAAIGTATVGASIAFQTGLSTTVAERMRITSSGFVGIGTTAPTYRLQVSDTIASVTAFGNFAALQSIGGTGYRWSLNNDSTFRLQYTTNGFSTITTPLFVTSNGALGVGVTPTNTAGRLEAANDIVAYSSSDKRWKTNIKNIDSPLEKISKINGVEFDWIEDEPVHGNKGHDVGVIAQEIEQILPDIVQTRESGMKAVQYDKIIPLLIESIKEQQKQIEELKEILNGITK